MTEPRGQELINRYRWNYGIPKDAKLTEEMILAHWALEQRLTRELLESTPENRWETFEHCYTTLYGELDWLNRLTGGTDTTPAEVRYRHWAELIGTPPRQIYEVGSGKAAMIGYLAALRELRDAVISSGFREVGAVRITLQDSGGVSRSDAAWLKRICLIGSIFAPFARPILGERMARLAKHFGIAPLVFLAAKK